MSRKKKLERFAEMKTFRNVFEPTTEEAMQQEYPLKGKWREDYFANNYPIILELGCGKGEYSIGLARKFPKRNFIGVDIKGARMWRGAKTALEEDLDNVAFLRTRIEFINAFFAEGEVDEIWVTFPDPQPKIEKKRLTCAGMLDKYKKFLKSGGIVHLKTDNYPLYEYTLEVIDKEGYQPIEHTSDLYGQTIDNLDKETASILGIKTHYEGIFSEKGFKINYLKFHLNGNGKAR